MNVSLFYPPSTPQNAEITVTGSKSESNRLLILQAIFGQIHLHNISESDDTLILQEALKTDSGTVNIHHAGTAMRFLTAYFASKINTEIVLTGSDRMQQRPIIILVDALREIGADIQYLKAEGFPPLKIVGKKFTKSEVSIKSGVSSQYISALMLVAPSLPHGLRIVLEGQITSAPYIEMTLSLLRKIGINGEFKEHIIIIPPISKIPSQEINIESDWSSASYFYSAVALSDNLEIKLKTYFKESLQGDSKLVSIYKNLGVKTFFDPSENSITLKKTKTILPEQLNLDLKDTPDIAQTIAVTCLGLKLRCKLTGLQTLKIKETDRLEALKTELEKLGATVSITNKEIEMVPPLKLESGIAIDTYQDHRMAMAFAPLAIKIPLTINHADVVSKSYPSFWEDIRKIGIHVKLEP